MKALILNNKVVDLVETEFEVSPEMSWIDCDDTVKFGYTYADGTFTAPEEYIPNYENARRSEYPPIGDQLDDLFHAGAFSDEMTAKIQAVKDTHPKPTFNSET